MSNLQCIASNNGTGAATNSLTVPSTSNGSCLGLIIGIDSTESLSSVSDPINGDWTVLTQKVVATGANIYVALFFNNAGWSTSQNLTITLNSAKDAIYFFLEESGILTVSGLDGATGQNQASVNSWSSGNLSTTSPNDSLYSFAFSSTSSTMGYSTPGPWTAVTGTGITGGENSNGAGGCMAFMARQAVTSTGSYAATGTTSTTGSISSLILALKQSTTGLIAAYGPYSITGIAVTFSVNTSIPNLLAACGSYNISLASASSYVDLISAAGIYSYTGFAASLVPVVSPVTLTAAFGSYSIAAQNAQLSNQQIVIAGIYSISGKNATLAAVQSIVAANGSYFISGQNAGLSPGGTGVAVPNCVGLTQAAAVAALQALGFDQISIDLVYVVPVPYGLIAGQYPPAHTVVTIGTPVVLFESIGPSVPQSELIN